jgi:endonuclease-3
MTGSTRVSQVAGLLAKEYGELAWSRHCDPLSELVQTILSQNTSDHNSRRAFEALMDRFGDWWAVAGADVGEIADAIRSGGMEHVKAPRIRQILGRILEERGSFDLTFLEGMPLGEARDWLLALPGVGPKTAACVLLFSLGKPALPVDTHVHRVAKRLGLIGSKDSVERAHEVLGALVPPDQVYQFHIHMIEHGRRVCKSQRPRCSSCVLLQLCPAGELLVESALGNKVKA